ncbi:MAG: hypothetical protein ACRYHQ_11075 [Janthinobacterium lividum]
MPRTLLLDRTTWTLCLDASGNIAIADAPYALAQDAASAIRLFLGEGWYDVDLGVPYFQQILGQYPSLPFVKGQMVAAAETVPGVTAATVYLSGLSHRTLTGQVQVTDAAGTMTSASF